MILLGHISFKDEDGVWYAEIPHEDGKVRSWTNHRGGRALFTPPEAEAIMLDVYTNQGRKNVTYTATF